MYNTEITWHRRYFLYNIHKSYFSLIKFEMVVQTWVRAQWFWTHKLLLLLDSAVPKVGFPGGSEVKNSPAMQEMETWVQSLGWEDPLKEEMAKQSSILAWKIQRSLAGYSPWGHKRIGHNWATEHPTGMALVHEVRDDCSRSLHSAIKRRTEKKAVWLPSFPFKGAAQKLHKPFLLIWSHWLELGYMLLYEGGWEKCSL